MSKKTKFGKYVVHQEDRDNWQRFAIDCSCYDKEHRTTIDLEVNKEEGDVNLTFYKDLFVYDKEQYPLKYYSECKNPIEFLDLLYQRISYWISLQWKRTKRSFQIFFTGHSRFEGDFYMWDLEHIDEFIEALKYSRDEMAKCKGKFDEKIKKEYEDSLKFSSSIENSNGQTK